MAFTKFELLTSPSLEKIRILSILFLTTQRDPRKFPASTAVPVLAFPSSYLKVPIMTKGSVAFVVSTDPDVHFKCCISADSKVQASIQHETKVKLIQACRVHSGALDELTSQQSTGKCSLFLFFKLGHIALTFLVVIWLVLVEDSVVIKTVNEDFLRLSSSPSVPSTCGRTYRRNLSERRLQLICDRHNLLLEYHASHEN